MSWPAPMASNDGNAKPIKPPAAGMIVAVKPDLARLVAVGPLLGLLDLAAGRGDAVGGVLEREPDARQVDARAASVRRASFHSRILASAGSREQSKQLVTVNSTLTAVGVPSESSARIRHVPGIRLGPSMGWMMLPIPTMSLGDPQAGRSQLPSAGRLDARLDDADATALDVGGHVDEERVVVDELVVGLLLRVHRDRVVERRPARQVPARPAHRRPSATRTGAGRGAAGGRRGSSSRHRHHDCVSSAQRAPGDDPGPANRGADTPNGGRAGRRGRGRGDHAEPAVVSAPSRSW